MRVEVYTRAHCSLCEEAGAVLEQVRRRIPFELVWIDIDADPELRRIYRYDIPVIFINGHKAFKHRVEAAALLDRLRRENGTWVAD